MDETVTRVGDPKASTPTTARSLIIALVAVLALPANAQLAVPSPIAAYLQRSVQCEGTPLSYAHFRKRLACDRLPADKARLEVRYRNDPIALADLNGHWVKVVQRLPRAN